MFRVDMQSTAHFITSFTWMFGIGSDDLWAVCHSFSHIVHLEYVLGGLGLGYDVAIVDVLRLVISGADLQPSVLVTVPSVYEQIANQVRRRLAADDLADADVDGFVTARWEAHKGGDRPGLLPQAAEVLGARLKMMLIGAAPSAASLKQFLLGAGFPVFEGYGMSETNMISCNSPQDYRLGTVGPMWPEVEARIDDEGVLYVRTDFFRTDRYLNVSDEDNAAVFLEDGWVNTGDLAEMDDGFLRLVGRKKEILISAGGKNINVAAIEARLREHRDVGHVVLFGDRRPYLVGVFAPLPGVPLPAEDTLRKMVERTNEGLPLHERVLEIIRLDTPFDVDSGLLTRSGKPRRQLIEQRLGQLIDQCYA
jgi:long-chain acyl-CoA synthetase